MNNTDKEIFDLIEEELQREENGLEMIASENFVSPAILRATGSILTNKYAEGYPGHRYYGGCYVVDKVEQIAIERAKQLFSCNFANVQPHSGSSANLAVYAALVKPGDTVLGMSLDCGGHLTHGSKVSFSGKIYNSVSYGTNDDGYLDYDGIAAMIKEYKPAMVIAGASAYPRIIDFKRIREIIDSQSTEDYKPYFMVDMAHIAGLVAAGLHPSPLPYADVVTTTCHKTLRGPRSGLILTNDPDVAKKVDKAIFPGNQGGPLEHIIAAKAICFGEALQPSFKDYQKNIVANAARLADKLIEKGFDLVTGGTDNHLMLINLRSMSITGRDMEDRLSDVGITVNKNSIPHDPEKPTVTSGVRVGTPALTTRGFTLDDMDIIADIFADVAKNQNLDECRAKVADLCRRHPLFYR